MFRTISLVLVVLIAGLGCKFSSLSAAGPDNSNAQNISTATPTSPDNAVAPDPVATPRPAAANAVCSDPSSPCQHKDKKFDEWELSFKMPAKLKENTVYKSESFYAVMVETYTLEDDCDGGEFIIAVEKKRKDLQRTVAGKKVFAFYSCPNLSGVGYDFDGRFSSDKQMSLIDNFLAVYAGTSKADADIMLKDLKTKWPDAVVKRMVAEYEAMSF